MKTQVQNRPRGPMKKKQRVESGLSKLPEARQAELVEFALTHETPETLGWLADQGIHCTAALLDQFLSRYQLTRQLERNAATVETLIQMLAAHEQTITPERLQWLGQIFFAELALEKRDPRIWQLAQELELKKQRLELDRQKHREKMQALQGETDKPAGGLAPETLDRIEREIKLM